MEQRDNSFEIPPVERTSSALPPLAHVLPLNGLSNSSLLGEDETKALKRRVAQLEAENERLKSSIVALTERLNRKRRDSGCVTLESLINQSAPGPSLTPSPTMAPQPAPTARRHSNDVPAAFQKPSNARDPLNADDDMDGFDPLHLPSDSYICRTTFQTDSPVYQCRFNQEGTLIACTGMDASVHLWTLNGASDVIVGSHAQAGSDVTWIASNLVASSSLDMSVKVWDAIKPNPDSALASFTTSGLALCVSQLPDSSNLVVGTSSGAIQLFDVRVPSSASSTVSSSGSSSIGTPDQSLQAEGSVNAICCGANANVVISGDNKGYVRAFDLRMAGHIDLYVIEGKRPISGLAWSPVGSGLLAVNSYDNALRVFTRDSASDSIKLVHTLRGHRSKNLPIRSAFSSSTTNATSVALATGSANNACYVFYPISMSQEEPVSTQMLKGHSNSVYACDFSPENLLATCSVDGTIKLWSKRS